MNRRIAQTSWGVQAVKNVGLGLNIRRMDARLGELGCK